MPRGGYRPGSGPKKGTKYKTKNKKAVGTKAAVDDEVKNGAKAAGKTPLEYMLDIMNDELADDDRRDLMAKAAAPYVHPRADNAKSKKDERQEKANQAGKGRFAPRPAPLRSVK